MSKYEPLWEYIRNFGGNKTILAFAEIKSVLGFEIDHSFLTYKKELMRYGYEIEKISIKEKTAKYRKC